MSATSTEVRAAVWHGPRDVRLETLELGPDPAPGWVRIAVEWCGICGSDIEEYLEGPIAIPSTDGTAAPLALGHEFSGVVCSVGPGATRFAPGDRVAVDTLIRCGSCSWCQRGEFNCCPKLEVVGLTRHGGFAEYVDTPENTCYPIPDGLELDRAALAEPVAVALRAVARGELRLGRPVLVAGCGTIGLLCAALAALGGAHPIVAVEPNPGRRTLAQRAGADRLLERFDAAAFDVEAPWTVIDCTGRLAATGAAVEHAPPQSRIVVVGVGARELRLDAFQLLLREHVVLGSVSHNATDFSSALALLATPETDFDWLLSERVGLDGVVGAFDRLAGANPAAVKILVTPGEVR